RPSRKKRLRRGRPTTRCSGTHSDEGSRSVGGNSLIHRVSNCRAPYVKVGRNDVTDAAKTQRRGEGRTSFDVRPSPRLCVFAASVTSFRPTLTYGARQFETR